MSPTFSELGVPEHIVRALDARGITAPFAIQAATIADALDGRDVCGRAPTGSGKTIAFGIPTVATVAKGQPKRPKALILAPTRELADQIADEMRTFAGNRRIGVVYGGVGYGPQRSALKNGVDILVACPGRLEDLISEGTVSLGDVDIVVLDEADRMADMGFMPVVKRLLDQTSSQRQTLLFSATLDGDVAELTERYQRDPVRHEVGEETPDITAAEHLFWKLDRADRIDVCAQAVTTAWPAIIFTRTRHGADRLAKQLTKRGVQAAAIHGGRSQAQRTRALNDFTDNRVEALVATDVAARGIHVDGVAAVVQFDPPEDHKAYIHRAGRTARAGEGGVVISLLTPDQVKEARKTQRRAGLDVEITEPRADMLTATPKPERREERRSNQGASKPKQQRRNGKPKSQGQSRNGQRKKTAQNTKSDEQRSKRNGQARSQERQSDGPEQRPSRKPKSQGQKPQGQNKNKKRRSADNAGGTPSKKQRRSKKGQVANATSGPGGRPNRKARRAHLQRQG